MHRMPDKNDSFDSKSLDNPLPSDEPCPNGLDACPIFEEVDQLKKENKQLKMQVIEDPLTGLYNRRKMFDSLEKETERTRRSGQPTSIALLDLDYFKKVNDSYGHAAGDYVLKTVAQIIAANIRKLDIASRYGGEEFCIIFPSSYLLTAKNVAERVRRCIEKTSINLENQAINITASIGLATFEHSSSSSLENFVNSADEQLYRAKEKGRNQVCLPSTTREDEAQIDAQEKDALSQLFKRD